MTGNFGLSTQFKIGEITIDGQDVVGLFQVISLYESIFLPVITGDITLMDSDGADFIAQNKIEGNEDISFTFTDSREQQLTFQGKLNGFKDKLKDKQLGYFVLEFVVEGMWKNEETWVTKRFNEVAPQDIVSEMVGRITAGPHGSEDKMVGQGEPMSFVGARRRPTDIIQHVLTHAIATGNKTATATEQKKNQEEQTKGNTGFLFWQTLDGYRFSSIDGVLEAEVGTDWGEFKHQLPEQRTDLETTPG